MGRSRGSGDRFRSRRRQRGFQLLDVMVASTILVMAIVGVVSLILVTRAYNQTSTESADAHKGCQEILEAQLVKFDALSKSSNRESDLQAWADDLNNPATLFELPQLPRNPAVKITVTDLSAGWQDRWVWIQIAVVCKTDAKGLLAGNPVDYHAAAKTLKPLELRLTARRYSR